MGGLSWGFGYLGQPHLLTRYMAIRRTADLPKAGTIAMGWTLLSYWGAPFIGVVGVAVLGPNLADPEQVMPLLAKALMPGWTPAGDEHDDHAMQADNTNRWPADAAHVSGQRR